MSNCHLFLERLPRFELFTVRGSFFRTFAQPDSLRDDKGVCRDGERDNSSSLPEMKEKKSVSVNIFDSIYSR